MVVDFADFCIVTEHAAKCANLHFGWVTIKCGEMGAKWGRNGCRSLSRFENKIYIVDKYIFYGIGH
jgi:hypothetical protein